ncbi:hypothetical protein ABBQ32_001285 [Trebouxia sp. C0010 RCD-2024]
MSPTCGCWQLQQLQHSAGNTLSYSERCSTASVPQRLRLRQQFSAFQPRLRSGRPVGGRRKCAGFTLAAAKPQSQREGPEKSNFFTKLISPLRDFGLGKSSLWEGGVGLFIFAGIGFALMLITWARGGQLGRRGKGYQAVLEFPVACGISTGTPVRIRGVPVGSVLSVQPSLEQVNVLVEIKEPTTVIPRNSLIEANQSGLIAESLIDITPQLPIPDYKASPTSAGCEEEGLVVCRGGHIGGQPGVALDDLVYICTKIARQMDADGLSKVFDAAETASSAIEEARPLLENAVKLVDEVTPLLNELRQGNLVGNLENLTKSASEAASDIHRLQTEVSTLHMQLTYPPLQ